MAGLDRIKAFIDLDGSGFEVGAKRVTSAAEKVGHSITHHITDAVAGAVGVAAIEEITRKTIEYAAHVSDLGKRLGMTAEKAQELRYAFTSSGGSEQGMVSFLERLSTSREAALAGNKTAQSNFSRLGVSAQDLQTKNSDALMSIIGKAVQDGSVEKLRAPLRAVGGKGAGELIAGFKAGLEEKANEAREKGLVIGNETIAALHIIEEESKRFKDSLMVGLAPQLVVVIDKIYDMVGGLKVMAAFLGGLSSQVTLGNMKKQLLTEPSTAFNPLQFWGKLLSKGWKDAVDSADKVVDEESKKKIQRQIDRIVGSAAPQETYSPSAVAQQAATNSVRDRNLAIDSLQRIGGFVGVGAEMPMVNIAREQLVELKTIAKNTTPKMASSTYDDSMVDEP